MIGIELEIENKYNSFLNELFKNVKLENFEINITEDEIYYNNQNLSIEKIYSKGKFKSNIYIIFLNLKIYPKNYTYNEIIKTYQDFLESACQLIVLISDVEFIEIYFKDENIRKTILNNLDKKQIKYVLKTISNDTRTIMSVI